MRKIYILLWSLLLAGAASAQDFTLKNYTDHFSILQNGQGINIIGNNITDNLGVYFLKGTSNSFLKITDTTGNHPNVLSYTFFNTHRSVASNLRMDSLFALTVRTSSANTFTNTNTFNGATVFGGNVTLSNFLYIPNTTNNAVLYNGGGIMQESTGMFQGGTTKLMLGWYGEAPYAVAMFNSSTQGVIFPQVTQTNRNAINLAPSGYAPYSYGLQLYQTDGTPGQYVNLNGTWQRFLTTSDLSTIGSASGTAGGDLSGSYPNPTVAQFNGQLPSYYLNYNNLNNKPTPYDTTNIFHLHGTGQTVLQNPYFQNGLTTTGILDYGPAQFSSTVQFHGAVIVTDGNTQAFYNSSGTSHYSLAFGSSSLGEGFAIWNGSSGVELINNNLYDVSGVPYLKAGGSVSPGGTAGGDLTGTYPNPAVSTINGITKSYYDPTSSIQTQLNDKATDANVVHLAGAETITGAKTFSGTNSFTNSNTFSGSLNTFNTAVTINGTTAITGAFSISQTTGSASSGININSGVINMSATAGLMDNFSQLNASPQSIYGCVPNAAGYQFVRVSANSLATFLGINSSSGSSQSVKLNNFTPSYTPGDYSSLGGAIGWSRPVDGLATYHAMYEYVATGGHNNFAITSANDISFINNAVESMRLSSAGNILMGTTAEISSSKLTVTSTSQGFLPPRMTTSQKNAISSPAEGLIVYDTSVHQLSYYNGGAWKNTVITDVNGNIVTDNKITTPDGHDLFNTGSTWIYYTYNPDGTTTVHTASVSVDANKNATVSL